MNNLFSNIRTVLEGFLLYSKYKIVGDPASNPFYNLLDVENLKNSFESLNQQNNKFLKLVVPVDFTKFGVLAKEQMEVVINEVIKELKLNTDITTE